MHRGERTAVDRRQPQSRGMEMENFLPTFNLSLIMGKPSAKSQLTDTLQSTSPVFLETAPVIKHQGSLRNPHSQEEPRDTE